MGSFVRSQALPQRNSQLFADNKRSYEALVQTRPAAPELTHLVLKLRIQKDRLIAWGIQWADRSTAAHAGDIDKPLDQAGIGDLVASIMSSIKELLDEAETLQVQSDVVSIPRSGLGKEISLAGDINMTADGEWMSTNLKRLEDIIKDLTTSLDTLCDLSRPRVEGISTETTQSKGRKLMDSTFHDPPRAAGPLVHSAPLTSTNQGRPTRQISPHRRDDLTDMAFIDSSLLRQRATQSRSTSAPPSYESIASWPENRVLAYFSFPSSRPSLQALSSGTPETPVLLDYRQHSSKVGSNASRPDSSRFEELLLALLKFSTSRANTYTGILKLTGWTVDTQRSRCAYVYEIPRPEGDSIPRPIAEIQPRSLLFFLQNGGDADSNKIPCLENRFRLALNVASSVMHLHEMNVTHRHVNSNNLLFFIDQRTLATQDRVWKGPIIRKPYLTGFHQQSVDAAAMEHDTPFSGLYYHPKLGSGPREAYSYVHDYYSLGLILLEIGLWMPIGKFWKSKYSLWDFKARLQDIYMKKLSAKCGDAFMNAVLFCMTAADEPEGRSAGENLTTIDDSKKATEFHWSVIRSLEKCCLMDEDIEQKPLMENAGAQTEEINLAQDLQRPAGLNDRRSVSVGKSSNLIELPSKGTGLIFPTQEVTKQLLPSIPKIKVWSHELPDLYSKYWISTMFPKLERILRKAISRWETYTIDLFMAGENADVARPTIYMECTSTSKVRRILRHLNKDLRLFEIRVVSGEIVRSKAGKKKKRPSKKKGKEILAAEGMGTESSYEDLNPHYQPKPGCGASIGAYLDGTHLPPVTFGGAVLVNGEPFGMSVHHMLEDDEEMELALDDAVDLQRSMAPRGCAPKPGSISLTELDDRFADLYPFEVSEPAEAEDASSTGYAYSDCSNRDFGRAAPPEAPYPFEISDDDLDQQDANDDDADDPENDFWLSPNFDATSTRSEDDDEDCDMGDTEGIQPGHGSSLMVTQPAFEDVGPGFFPSVDDADAEHLSSHVLGHIHASSGLRRFRTPDDLVHEIDWALIKINPNRLTAPLNQPPTSGPPNFKEPPPYHPDPPTTILPSSALAARKVHSHARSSGTFARGTILPAMRLVCMPGRVSPSHSWQVRGSFGAGGDSGAWVFDDSTGAVCGHVLAFSEKSQVAYIAPMEVLVGDMERVLDMRVCLPRKVEAETKTRGEVGSNAKMEEGMLRGVGGGGSRGGIRGLEEWTEVDGSWSPAFPTSPPAMVGDLEEKRARGGKDVRGGFDGAATAWGIKARA